MEEHTTALALSSSVPALTDDVGSTSMSVTALAFADAEANEYNYPKLERPLRELLETEREYVLRIKAINNVRLPFRSHHTALLTCHTGLCQTTTHARQYCADSRGGQHSFQ